MSETPTLGQAIRQHRARYGLTQDSIATDMRVSRSWVAGVETEKGKGRPDAVFVARAAEYLRLPRRQAFVMAGYTTGEVLDLFGAEVPERAPHTPDIILTRLDQVVALLEVKSPPPSGTTGLQLVEEQIARGVERGLRDLLAGALREQILRGPASQSTESAGTPAPQDPSRESLA